MKFTKCAPLQAEGLEFEVFVVLHIVDLDMRSRVNSFLFRPFSLQAILRGVGIFPGVGLNEAGSTPRAGLEVENVTLSKPEI